MKMTRWVVFCFGLFAWGCAATVTTDDFIFTPTTDEIYPEVQEARLIRNGVSEPHKVIGELTVLGDLEEPQELVESRLLEEARRVGAEGVIVVERGREYTEKARAGVRPDDPGGAAKEYRFFPSSIPIQEERIFIRGMAIRFIRE
jgi:hypothetical protein